MALKKGKTEIVSARIPVEAVKMIEALGKVETRTRGNMILVLLLEALKARGY